MGAARAVGGTAPSSDYDVTFLGLTAAAVQFNRELCEGWGSESGPVLDTNVRAQDLLGAKPAGGTREDDPTVMTTTGAADDKVLQDANPLVKARKNMPRGSWAMFANRVAFALPPTPHGHAREQLGVANATYRTTYVGSLIARLSPAEVASMRAAGETGSEIVEELETGADGVEAANREYEAQLLEVGRLEPGRDALATASQGPPARERWTQLTLDIRKAKSKAMLFANDPHLSAGTRYHVVGNMQGAWGVKLGVPEYLRSPTRTSAASRRRSPTAAATTRRGRSSSVSPSQAPSTPSASSTPRPR